MRALYLAIALGALGCRTDFKPADDTGALAQTDDTGEPSVEPTDDTAPPVDTSPPIDTAPPVDTGDTALPVDDDVDGDGYTTKEDCDDSNSEIHPGADEVCDGLDNDCDLLIDPETALDASAWWLDVDGDGYGDVDQEVIACDAPSGFVDDATDCDDAEDTVNPGAPEICDGLDNDCDGLGDDDDPDLTGSTTWYLDADADGYGVSAYAVEACDQPEGFADNTDDCDDGDDTVFLGANEVCDEQDNDCDGDVDEAADGAGTWYLDADGDGYGDAGTSTESCDGATGYVADATDCDDADAELNPAASELCDGIDNDCDGLFDEDDSDLADAATWYADGDGDGYGDADDAIEACSASDRVSDDTDCDDGDAAVNPDADEVCDGVDNDCDTLTDDDDPGLTDAGTWYLDFDSDGFGGGTYSTESCEAPTGYVADTSDCNDAAGSVNPDADELCDGVDNDCDGTVDIGASDEATWYADVDGDGFGDAASSTSDCSAPSGYVDDSADCDDGDGAVNPDADEVCDGVDNDCDGTLDVGASDVSTWYADGDGDGFGDAATSSESCDAASGYVGDATDCDDGDGAVNPDADEVCDEVDNDCDGTVDVDASDASTWYLDYDGDGFGGSSITEEACDAPSGYVAAADDCDDGDASVGDEVTWYGDGDGDGFGDATDTAGVCEAPSGYVATGDDCDDGDASVSPAAEELCDGIDNDCDGRTDLGASDETTWNIDYDGDGYGSSAYTSDSCDQPSGYVADATDCDDADASISPAGTEVCNGADDDCDGDTDEDEATDVSTWYADADGDGYGDVDSTTATCDLPSGYSADATDCDDADSSINPGATEICNGIDDDCDDEADQGVIGSEATCAGESCLDVLERGSPTGTGDFWLEDSSGTYEETCVFGTVGGGWSYRVDFTIENATSDDLTDEWVAVVVDTETLLDDGKLQAAGEDIRFFTHDGPLMAHWIEAGFDSTATTWWIEVPSLPAGDTVDFTLTYGNADTERTAMGWHFDDFGTDRSSEYDTLYNSSWGTPSWDFDTASGYLGTDSSNMDYFLSVASLELGEPVFVAIHAWIYDNDGIGAMLMDADGGYTTAVISDDYEGDNHNGGLESIVYNASEPSTHYTGTTLVSAGNLVTASGGATVGLYYDGTDLALYLDGDEEASVAADYAYEGAGVGSFASSGSPGAAVDWLWVGSEPIDFDPSAVSSDAVSTVGSEAGF